MELCTQASMDTGHALGPGHHQEVTVDCCRIDWGRVSTKITPQGRTLGGRPSCLEEWLLAVPSVLEPRDKRPPRPGLSTECQRSVSTTCLAVCRQCRCGMS